MKRNARKGFTLIEVLVVVMIIAMLAAFGLPRIMQAGDKAKVDIARSDVGPSGRLATSLNMFKLYVGRYPTTEEGLAALVDKPSTLEGAEADGWQKLLDNAAALKDPWSQGYGYRYPGEVNADGYDLWSNGPDRQNGTQDDVRNWVTDNVVQYN
jgi:general secretion pathway protein G